MNGLLKTITLLFIVLFFTLPLSTAWAVGDGGVEGSNGELPLLLAEVFPDKNEVWICLYNVAECADKMWVYYGLEEASIDISQLCGPGAKLCVNPDPETGFGKHIVQEGENIFNFSDFHQGKTYYLQAFVHDPELDQSVNRLRLAISNGIKVYLSNAIQSIPIQKRAGDLPFALAYNSSVRDPNAGSFYIFGGYNEEGPSDKIVRIEPNESWGEDIQELEVTLPSARYGTSAVWDTQRKVAYVFGGKDMDGYLDEILQFNPLDESLTLLSDLLPSGRYLTAACWDPCRNVAYLFGGKVSGNIKIWDIVEFDPNKDPGSRISVLSDTLPCKISGTSACWNSLSNTCLLFGGDSSRYIFEFNPGAQEGERVSVFWDDPFPWSSLAYCSSTFDTETKKAYIFGGTPCGPPLPDIWEFDPQKDPGEKLKKTGTLPFAVYYSSAAYDSSSKLSLIFGGREYSVYSKSIFVFNPALDPESNCSTLRSVPPDSGFSSAAMDSNNRKIYLFGGYSSGLYSNKILEIDLDQPIGLESSILDIRLPTERCGSASVWDPEGKVTYIFGGKNSSGVLSDILKFHPSSNSVTLLEDALPSGRCGLAAVWNPLEEVAYLFGGIQGNSIKTNEILKFDPKKEPGERVEVLPEILPLKYAGMGAS